MKRMDTSRLAVCIILTIAVIAACGPSAVPQIKGTLQDECSKPGTSLQGAKFSLAPTQDGENLGLALVDGRWLGSTAVTETDASGHFAFNDIPEGKYGLLIFQTQVRDAQLNPLVIQVTKGGHQDLGMLKLVKSSGGGCTIIYPAT